MDRKIVAAFIADIYRDMVRETEYGTIQEAMRNNVKLLFFASFSDNFSTVEYTHLTNYDVGDSAIYRVPDLNNFDGLITYDSYLPETFLEIINDIKKDAPCPVVTLGVVSDHSYSVINDLQPSLKELIEHLIKDHGCKELVHVSGPTDLSFCRDRIKGFKETLEANGLPCTDEQIFPGNLWYSCAEEVVTSIMKRYENDQERLFPDAIVCANDYTAIGVVDELNKRGYIVPDDVIVVGYDDVIQSRFHDPSITTSCQPFGQVGKDGIKLLKKIWEGENVPAVTAEPGILKRRQSCGCTPKHIYQQDDLRESYATVIDRLGMLSRSSADLILSISNASDNSDVFNEIEANCCNNTGFKDAVLCLINDWDKQKVYSMQADFEDATFEVVCGVYNGRPVRRGVLPKGQLLPQAMLEDPYAYYLVPVHHLQYFLGYFIVSPDLENLSQFNIKSWFIYISTMLENWRIRKELNYTVERLQNLYVTDMLTGLYNRRGYGLHFENYYKECRESGAKLAVFLIDMDNMKQINDTYGHDEGDYCLCTIGKALKAAKKADEICVRSGGDEFVVLAKNYTEEDRDTYIVKVREFLEESCREDQKAFDISVSIGCYMAKPDESEVAISEISERYLRKADRLMYAEKKEHKKQKLNND